MVCFIPSTFLSAFSAFLKESLAKNCVRSSASLLAQSGPGKKHVCWAFLGVCASKFRALLIVMLRIGRAAGSITPTTSPTNPIRLAASWFAGIRSVVISPARLSCALLNCHASAAARRAASLRLGRKTGPLLRPLVFCPRFGPSALLRTPTHFSVCTAGAGETFPRP